MTAASVIESVAYRAVETDRAYYLRELVSAVVGQAGLSPQAESEMRRALTARIDPLLDLADCAVAARAELEAVERRLDRHVQQHDLCRIGVVQGCWALKALVQDVDRLQRVADREMRRLLGGGHR